MNQKCSVPPHRGQPIAPETYESSVKQLNEYLFAIYNLHSVIRNVKKPSNIENTNNNDLMSTSIPKQRTIATIATTTIKLNFYEIIRASSYKLNLNEM